MDLTTRIDELRAALDDLPGHEPAKSAIRAELDAMRRDADRDLDTRRIRARSLATVLRKERSLAQTRVGQELVTLTAEYAS